MMRKHKKSCLAICLILSTLLAACGSSGYSSVNDTTSGLNISADTSVTGSSIMSGFSSSKHTNYTSKSEAYDIEEIVESFNSSDDNSSSVNSDIENVESDLDTITNQDVTNTDIEYVDTKLIYHCNLYVETLDYDASYSKLQTLINKYDCFIESENFTDNESSYYSNGYTRGRENNIVVRIPSENYQAFLNEEDELGNILSKSSNVENITMEYYDTTSQIQGLEYQLDRLVEMLRQTTEVSDMITINREITNVEDQINSLKTTVRTYDMDVAYSYIGIDLVEVVEYSEVREPVKKSTFIDRLKNQLVDTWEDFLANLEDLLFGIIDLLPTLIIVGLVVLLVIIINKISKKNNKGIIAEAEILLSEQSEKPADENIEE